MITYPLLVSVLCLSTGCYIVYRMSTGVTVTGTQDEGAFLAAKRARSTKPVAELDPPKPLDATRSSAARPPVKASAPRPCAVQSPGSARRIS